jgi:hypothetical protein
MSESILGMDSLRHASELAIAAQRGNVTVSAKMCIEMLDRIAELEAERDKLREAISNHKLKLNATAAIPTSIDRELWAALDREIVYQTEDEIPVDRAGRKMYNKFGDKLDIGER